MPRDPKEEETARRRRAVFAVVGVLAVLGLGLVLAPGDDGRSLVDEWVADRPVRQGELPDGGRRHARHGRADAGVGHDVSDSGTLEAHHEILPEIADPQLPSEESDPRSYDPGPGDEFIERYEGRSGRLSPHSSIHGTRSSVPVRSHMAAPNVLAWTPTTIASAGQPVVIHAMVRGAHDEDVVPTTFEVTFYNGLDPSTGTPQPLQPGDDEYSYTYVPTAEAHPMADDGAPALVWFLVRATGTYDGESYSRSATGSFRLHSPGARLDGEGAQASRRGSDIVVEVPVQVDRPGAYFGFAELWGGADATTPVAFARDRVELAEPGPATFTFLFGGAVIQASGVDGPYMVRNVRWMQVDSIPPHEQAPIEELLTTPDWQASTFH